MHEIETNIMGVTERDRACVTELIWTFSFDWFDNTYDRYRGIALTPYFLL